MRKPLFPILAIIAIAISFIYVTFVSFNLVSMIIFVTTITLVVFALRAGFTPTRSTEDISIKKNGDGWSRVERMQEGKVDIHGEFVKRNHISDGTSSPPK